MNKQDTFDTNDTNDTFDTGDTKRYKDDTNLDTRIAHPELSFADKVRKWIDITDGVFHYTDLARDMQLFNTNKRDNTISVRNILSRLCKENVLERVGTKSGTYQRVDSSFTPTKLFQTEGDEYHCVLPLGMSEFVKLQPGNLVVIAGDSNAAKTWLLLEFCRLNLHTHRIRYINSEMSDQELDGRLRCYEGRMDLNDWYKVEFGTIEDRYHHHILPDAVTIIDFIDIHADFYRMGEILKYIHEKLNKGICIVALQKKQGSPLGKGGAVTKEKSRLYVSLNLVEKPERGFFIMARLEKVKISRDPESNANGLVRSFEVRAMDASAITYGNWHRPSKEEYKMLADGRVH